MCSHTKILLKFLLFFLCFRENLFKDVINFCENENIQHNCRGNFYFDAERNQIVEGNTNINFSKMLFKEISSQSLYSKWKWINYSTIYKDFIENNNQQNRIFILNNENHDYHFQHHLIKDDNLKIEKGNENEKEIFSALRDKILKFSSPFDTSQSLYASQSCKDHTRIFLNALENLELWALKMHDSSARLTSGIINGNINQLGDFDQCLSVQSPKQNIHGQYCLAYMQPEISTSSSYLKTLLNLLQSHSAFKSEFYDPGHRVPRFSLINWGVCIPSSCSAKDVEYVLKETIRNVTQGIVGLDFKVRVDPQMCQTNNSAVVDTNTSIVIGFFVLIIVVCMLSTFYDYFTTNSLQNDWFVAFSFKKNISWLFNTEKSADDISAIHGIRFFNALMLILAHKSLALFFVPYVNRTQMAESLGKSWTVIGRAASLYTEPFLLFSGMLTAYSIVGKLQKNRPLKLKNEYISRFLRIVPPLGALIMFCTFILPLLGSGPQWNLVIGHHATLCKKYWWRNLLFIHNYFGFSDMCLTHTHHLGIDTELFMTAPFVTIMLWKRPRQGLYFLLGLAFLATIARFHTTIVNELSNYVYFGTTIQRLFRTADYMYSFPPYRATIYILGLLLGYALRLCKGKQLTNLQLLCGWIISTVVFIITVVVPAPMGNINYQYNSLHAAIYAAFAPLGWCMLFSWIVFVSHLGYTNKITKFMSWRGFQITTKLSYAIYLTQFPVFFFNVGQRRHSDYFRFIPLLLNFNELLCIILASILLTLIFDAPFQNIKKIILNNNSSTTNNNNEINLKVKEN